MILFFDVLIRTLLILSILILFYDFIFDYHNSRISYLYSLYYYEIFLPHGIVRNNIH